MGASYRKPQKIIPGPALSYDEILFILKKSLIMTMEPKYIEYILVEGRDYQTVDRGSVGRVLQSADFEKELTRNPSRAIFRATGNFRLAVWGGPRRYPCYLFIDNKRLVWIIDPISQTFDLPRHTYQIDTVTSL